MGIFVIIQDRVRVFKHYCNPNFSYSRLIAAHTY